MSFAAWSSVSFQTDMTSTSSSTVVSIDYAGDCSSLGTLLIIARSPPGGIQRRHPAHEFPDEDWDEVSCTSQDLDVSSADTPAGLASQLERSIHPLPRCRSLPAHARAEGQPGSSRLDHQHCFPCKLPGRPQCAGIRKREGWRYPVDQVAVKPMGKPRHQRQCCRSRFGPIPPV